MSGSLGLRAQLIALIAAFSGWMFAGWEMSLLPLVARSASFDMLQAGSTVLSEQQLEEAAALWFARYIASFLLGAALGGWVFGWYGDYAGRVKAMGVSIIWYSVFTGLSYFVTTPVQMTGLRFIACMGIGGMWPAAVALIAEVWPDVTRPTLAGLIGAAANVGIALLGIFVRIVGDLMPHYQITPDSWRWIMVVSALPALLGVAVLVLVPESPKWLARQENTNGPATNANPLVTVFRPPILKFTLAGIALGTIPLLGAWGAQKWLIPWAGQVGTGIGNESLKADTQTIWAIGASIGSLCGGWLAAYLGRRRTYFLVSLGSLLLSGWIFRFLDPAEGWKFMGPVFLLGLVSTVYFGWLPLYLPEMFPTSVRSTGSGVSFNSGRIISAALVFLSGALVTTFEGDHAKIGATTSLVYVLGMIVVLMVPNPQRTVDELE